MKTCVAILSIFILNSARAEIPSIGSRATYEVTNSDSRFNHIEINEVESKNSEYEYGFSLQRIFPDETEIYHGVISSDEIYDPDLLKKCSLNGGNVENINVKAGNFESCKTTIERPDSNLRIESWEGIVPFLTIKTVFSDTSGVVRTFELTEVSK